MKSLKEIPDFANEEEEYEFWQKNDSTDFVDYGQAKKVRFPHLKKTTKSISIRLPVDMIEALKVKANAMDIPYQSYIKMILNEALKSA